MSGVGAKIEAELVRQGIAKSEFARMIGHARQNVNDILRRESLDAALLRVISEALGVNFFLDFQSDLRKVHPELDGGGLSALRKELEWKREWVCLLREKMERVQGNSEPENL